MCWAWRHLEEDVLLVRAVAVWWLFNKLGWVVML